jgi:hypothetical protein
LTSVHQNYKKNTIKKIILNKKIKLLSKQRFGYNVKHPLKCSWNNIKRWVILLVGRSCLKSGMNEREQFFFYQNKNYQLQETKV